MKKIGFFEQNGVKVEVVDLPGVYSLSVVSSASEDEKITRDYLLFNRPDCVVNILDASNLERNLYMTVQLFEMHLPVILVLNMMDTAAAAKIKIDVLALAHIFNVPVIPMVASKVRGVEELKKQIVRADLRINENFVIPYAPNVESAVGELLPCVSPAAEKTAGPPAGWRFICWTGILIRVCSVPKKIKRKLNGSEILFPKNIGKTPIRWLRTDVTGSLRKSAGN